MTYDEFIQDILNKRGRFACGDEYHERHHIIPKCFGGTNDEDNLIDLFAREHFIAHKLLALENQNDRGLQYAWWMMAHNTVNNFQDRYECTPEEYEEAKINIHNATSGENSPHWGKKLSDDVKAKMSRSRTGQKRSDETKRKMSESKRGERHPMYGKHHTAEARAKMSEKRKGCVPWNVGIPMSEDMKAKLLEFAKRPKSEEFKQFMSNRFKGEPKSQEHRKHLSEARIGKYTKGDSPHAKRVISDGIVFDCILSCAEYYGLKSSGNIGAFLHGKKSMPQKWKDRGLAWYEGGDGEG